jgi:Fe-S oxidoreductase
MFGPDLMQAFREFKALWDPHNRMNPGKLIDAVRVYDPLENLRHIVPAIPVPDAHAHDAELGIPRQRHETNFAFTLDNGSIVHATERCVGVGACRKADGGVMCPSYRATGEEQHSTRGRARLLWEMLAGALREEGFRSEAVHEALDLCLSCKACKTECPVQVDMAAYKSEFLAQHYAGRLHPLQHYVFGFADKLARWGSLAPELTNATLTGPFTGPLIKRLAGIAPERELPRLAPTPYVKANKSHKAAYVPRREAQLAPPQVMLWPDTWNNYYHPQTLTAAEAVLGQAGFRVEISKGDVCCGRPLYDFGFLGAARKYLTKILDRMAPQIDASMPLVFLEPSCASVFKDELQELFPKDPRAARLKDQVWLLADFLAEHAPDFAPNFAKGALAGRRILVHGHCHHKAVFGGPGNEITLLRNAGATVEPIQAGCCGMAGPFGFERDKYDVSKIIASDGLLPAVQAADADTLIVSDGFSCREQIAQLGHKRALHFAEVLAKAANTRPSDT